MTRRNTVWINVGCCSKSTLHLENISFFQISITPSSDKNQYNHEIASAFLQKKRKKIWILKEDYYRIQGIGIFLINKVWIPIPIPM